MRTPQRPVRASDSDSFLVVKISRRAAIILYLGLLAIAGAIAFRPTQTTASKSEAAVSPAPVATTDAARTSQPAEDSRESRPDAGATRATVSTPRASVPAASTEPVRAATDEPRPEPPPASTMVQRIVTYYPADPPASATPSDSSSNPDNKPADQPSDPSLPSTSLASADPPSPPGILPAFLNGAGSTSSYQLYTKWFDGFHRQLPAVRFNYQAVGSAAGVRQLLEGTIDFSAADAPLTDEQIGRAAFPILHIPSVIGAVVPVYNLPDVTELHLTPGILAEIFTGKITSWNDPQIVAHNPYVNLPVLPIVVIHRTDGCSSTQVFTDYLSKVSDEWQRRAGEGSSVNWPLGLGAKGNEGVHGLLKQYSGAISYMDFAYAIENHLVFASVQNRSGRFIKADPPSLTAAAASSKIPNSFRAWITNAPGSDAYPISNFEWFLVPLPRRGAPGTRDLAMFFRWMTEHKQQSEAPKFGFAPLPRELVDRIDQTILTMR